MVEGSDRTVALMAIHPHFAELILTGRKRVEFRRRRLTAALTHVVLYATDPIKAVVGYFETVRLTEASPRLLWRSYGAAAGIGASAFWRYYRGCSHGVAVEVGKVFRFAIAIPFGNLGLGLRPPQSVRYLPEHAVAQLFDHEARRVHPRPRVASQNTTCRK